MRMGMKMSSHLAIKMRNAMGIKNLFPRTSVIYTTRNARQAEERRAIKLVLGGKACMVVVAAAGISPSPLIHRRLSWWRYNASTQIDEDLAMYDDDTRPLSI